MSGNVKFTFPVNTRQLSPSSGARSGTTSSSSGSRSDDRQQAYSPELCGGEDAQRLFDQGHPGLYNAGEEGLDDWLARFRYEFNAQLLDDLTSNTGSVRPRAHFEAEVADEQLTSQADDQEQLSNYVHLFEPRVTHDLCFLQTLMQKTTQDWVTYQRANGNLVQLDHAGTTFSWRNMVTDVHTIPGAALGSNHFQPQETAPSKQTHSATGGGTKAGLQRPLLIPLLTGQHRDRKPNSSDSAGTTPLSTQPSNPPAGHRPKSKGPSTPGSPARHGS